ncbi:hypothetical protein ACTFIY_001773 [Dictyostelium cf. discoideum]
MQHESAKSTIGLTNTTNALMSNKIQLLKLLIKIDPSNSKIKSIQKEIDEYFNILDTKNQQKKATEFVKEVERVIEDANLDQDGTIDKEAVNEVYFNLKIIK